MNNKKIKYISYIFSFGVHALIIIIAAVFSFSAPIAEPEFVTIGFGTFGPANSSGAVRSKPKAEKKKVEVPKVKNIDKNNDAAPERKKVKKAEKKKTSNKKKGESNSGDNSGNYGFEIDFGGSGVRKIYSYSLPSYPAGVNKEIDIKLRFTILPDGTVGNVFPLRKADTRLESAAIRSIKQWRFEPIPARKNAKPQIAVITFPYRLR